MYQTIPIDNSPNQVFNCNLLVDGLNLRLRFLIRYNEVAEYWNMTLRNPVTGVDYITSTPLVSSYINLLEQYSYLKIGSAYLLKTGNVLNDYPNDVQLGNVFRLVWSDTE